MISIIIPLFNKQDSIHETINSVLNQYYRNFELIIVNDESTDRSMDVVRSFSDERIIIIEKKNGGVSSARNTGVSAAKFEHLAFIDADDIWHPRHLELLLSSILKFEEKKIGGAASTTYKSNSREFTEFELPVKEPILIKDYFSFMSAPKSRFNSSTIMLKKSRLMETGLFDEKLKYGEDVDCWMRLFSVYYLVYVDVNTSIYFTDAENRSTHKVISLKTRFHDFNYKGKSKSEKKYLDKLVALIIIDCIDQRNFKDLFSTLRLYYYRIFGVLGYCTKLMLLNFTKMLKG